MEVFLTGASGYAGFHAALRLAAAGHTVTGVVRNPAPPRLQALRTHQIKLIHGDDFARERRVQLGDCFHGLDGAENVVLRVRGADLGQLYVHDVAQLSLCVVRNADRDNVAVVGWLYVLMVLGIQQVLWNLGHESLR